MTEKNQEETFKTKWKNLNLEDKPGSKRIPYVPPHRRSQRSRDSTKAPLSESKTQKRVKLFESERRPTNRCKDEDRRVAEDMDKPSTITDQHFIWAYSPLSKEERSIWLDGEIGKTKSGGKWVLFVDQKTKDKTGLMEVDYVWHKVKKMTHIGDFYCAKTATAMKSDVRVNENFCVIMIYTKDCNDIEDVFETAQKIDFNFVLMRYILYKTNEASCKGMYRTEGSSSISLYKYHGGLLWKRHQNGQWLIVHRRKN